MKLTTKARYGLKICFILGLNYGDKHMSAPELSAMCGYSVKYVEKIMRSLKKADIVKSEKGSSGGYMLTAPPADISLGGIIRSLEDNLEFIDCINTDCKNMNRCPTHDVWRKLYTGINDLLDSMPLSDIIEDYEKGKGEYDEQVDIYGPRGDNKC